MCKTGGDRKAPSRRAFWALGRELTLALLGFALCRKLKSFEDEYDSSFPAGTLCSSEEIQTSVTGVPLEQRFAVCFYCCIRTWKYVAVMAWVCV